MVGNITNTLMKRNIINMPRIVFLKFFQEIRAQVAYSHQELNVSTLLLLLLLVRLHDQSSSSDEVGGLLQVLQAPI